MSTKQTLPAPTATRRSRIVFLLLIASVAVLTTLLLVPLLDNGRQSGIAWHWSAHRHAWKWNTGDHRRGGGADDNDIPRLCAHMRERRDEEDVRASTTSTTSTPRPFGITLEPPAWHNPRTFQNARLLIRNATVWTGLGEVLHGADVLMAGGIIQHIGNDVLSQGMGDAESADAPPILPLRVIEAHGRVLTPGIVDMHSHSGMSMWPAYDGADDVNEVSGPVMPQLRAIDAFSPEDPSVYLSAAGGVTTSLVLPGSANVMGGMATVFKNRPMPSRLVADMHIYGNSSSSADTNSTAMTTQRPWKWMKMAFGENPKRVYGSTDRIPTTRMGHAWLMRKEFQRARALMRAQDRWCMRRMRVDNDDEKEDFRRESSRAGEADEEFPVDLALQTLVELLRGKVKLNVHVYTTHDIETLFRLSAEFQFPIAAIHHALSAHLIAERVAAERERVGSLNKDLVAALFADKGYYKSEAYRASKHAPAILAHHGIPVALKSDHPVTNAQHLPYQAARAMHYGLTPQQALAAITSIPASAMGLSSRVGSIRVGMDADVVLWEGGAPVERVGAWPSVVVIDGMIVNEVRSMVLPQPSAPLPSSGVTMESVCDRLARGRPGTQLLVHLYNITRLFVDASTEFVNQAAELVLTVQSPGAVSYITSALAKSNPKSSVDGPFAFLGAINATVLCVGARGDCKDTIMHALPGMTMSDLYSYEWPGDSKIDGGMAYIALPLIDSTVMPAPIAALSHLGVTEIGMDTAANAGTSLLSAYDPIAMHGGVAAADALEFGVAHGDVYDGGYGKTLTIASRAGVKVAVALPIASESHVMIGQSALIYTGASSSHGIAKRVVGVHIHIGKHVAGGQFNGIAGQIAYVRDLLLTSTKSMEDGSKRNAMHDVLLGRIPLVAHVHNAEQISALLRSIDDSRDVLPDHGRALRLVIAGGSEAWMVADELKRNANVAGVILSPLLCRPENYDQRRCASMSSLRHPILLAREGYANMTALPTSVAALRMAGVPFVIAPEDDESVQDLIWEAGWLRWMSNRRVDGSIIEDISAMSEGEAVGAITWNVAEMLQLKDVYGGVGTISVGASLPGMVVYRDGNPLENFHARLHFSVGALGVRDSASESHKTFAERNIEIECNPVSL